tara:strand:+ start:300 stop:1850 length:1551 start_codon:yes stop_codon:yes gene_type:complete
MTITNQTNPVGTTHTSKKSQIIVPKEGITGLESSTKEKIYTAVTLTKSSNTPVKYRQQIIQYNDAKSKGYSVIATKNEDTGKFDFIDSNIDFKNTDQDAFKKLVEDQTKTQIKDAKGEINKKVNADVKAINKNEADSNTTDSTNSNKKQGRQGIARSNYGVLHYPAFIERSEQDKLKITILEFSTRFRGAKIPKSKLKSNRIPPKPVKIGSGRSAAKNYQDAMKVYNKKYGKNADKNRVNFGDINDSRLSLDNRSRIEANKRTVGHITLPIPDGVSDQNQVNFGDGRLNPLQVAGAETALKFFLGGGANDKAGENAAKAFDQAITDPNVKSAVSAIITGSVFGLDANELLARTEGNVLNNNLELLFKGPTLRPFNFSFNLSARDTSESRMIKKIIRAFKQSSAVQKTPGGVFLHAPNTYKLEFINGKTNKKHEFLPRVKECALLGVTMNYMPENTYMTYDDTSMVSYNMRLSFKELEPVFNDDYDKEDQSDTGERRGTVAASKHFQKSEDINSIGF